MIELINEENSAFETMKETYFAKATRPTITYYTTVEKTLELISDYGYGEDLLSVSNMIYELTKSLIEEYNIEINDDELMYNLDAYKLFNNSNDFGVRYLSKQFDYCMSIYYSTLQLVSLEHAYLIPRNVVAKKLYKGLVYICQTAYAMKDPIIKKSELQLTKTRFEKIIDMLMLMSPLSETPDNPENMSRAHNSISKEYILLLSDTLKIYNKEMKGE